MIGLLGLWALMMESFALDAFAGGADAEPDVDGSIDGTTGPDQTVNSHHPALNPFADVALADDKAHMEFPPDGQAVMPAAGQAGTQTPRDVALLVEDLV